MVVVFTISCKTKTIVVNVNKCFRITTALCHLTAVLSSEKVHWRSTGVVRWSVYGCVSYAVGVVLCFAQLIIKVERVNCIFDIVGVNSLYALSVHAMHAGKQ